MLQVGNIYLCKRDYIVNDPKKNWQVVANFYEGKYYRVRWIKDNIIHIEYGDGFCDVGVFHIRKKEDDDYDKAFCKYFYTNKEMRSKKIKEIMNENT
jgi:hypothetical protein